MNNEIQVWGWSNNLCFKKNITFFWGANGSDVRIGPTILRSLFGIKVAFGNDSCIFSLFFHRCLEPPPASNTSFCLVLSRQYLGWFGLPENVHDGLEIWHQIQFAYHLLYVYLHINNIPYIQVCTRGFEMSYFCHLCEARIGALLPHLQAEGGFYWAPICLQLISLINSIFRINLPICS